MGARSKDVLGWFVRAMEYAGRSVRGRVVELRLVGLGRAQLHGAQR